MGVTSDQNSCWPKVWQNVNLTWNLILRGYIWSKVKLTQSLTKFQPDPKLHLWRVYLTKGQADLKSDQMSTWSKTHPGGTSDQRSTWPKVWPNVNLTQSLICGGYIWLSAERLSNFLNTYDVLRKANNLMYLLTPSTYFQVLKVWRTTETYLTAMKIKNYLETK